MASSGQCSICDAALLPYSGKGRPRSLCAACRKENKRLGQLPHDRAYREKRRRLILAAKAQPCTDCGVQYPPVCMEFDHVRGEKAFGISTNTYHIGIARLTAEIAKCDVRCANCHRLRHWRERMQDPGDPPIVD